MGNRWISIEMRLGVCDWAIILVTLNVIGKPIFIVENIHTTISQRWSLIVGEHVHDILGLVYYRLQVISHTSLLVLTFAVDGICSFRKWNIFRNIFNCRWLIKILLVHFWVLLGIVLVLRTWQMLIGRTKRKISGRRHRANMINTFSWQGIAESTDRVTLMVVLLISHLLQLLKQIFIQNIYYLMDNLAFIGEVLLRNLNGKILEILLPFALYWLYLSMGGGMIDIVHVIWFLDLLLLYRGLTLSSDTIRRLIVKDSCVIYFLVEHFWNLHFLCGFILIIRIKHFLWGDMLIL